MEVLCLRWSYEDSQVKVDIIKCDLIIWSIYGAFEFNGALRIQWGTWSLIKRVKKEHII